MIFQEERKMKLKILIYCNRNYGNFANLKYSDSICPLLLQKQEGGQMSWFAACFFDASSRETASVFDLIG